MNTIKLSAPATKEFWEIPVLFEDDHLLALDKPSGLLTSPDRYNADRPNLMRLLHDGIAAKKPWVTTLGLTYLSNAHRLDADTSGVLLLAKNKPALIEIANLFSIKKGFYLKHGREERALMARVALHLEELSIPHPVTGEMITITSPMPKDLRVALRYLREFRGNGRTFGAARDEE